MDNIIIGNDGEDLYPWSVTDTDTGTLTLSDDEAVDLYRKLGAALAERGLIEGAK